jgi:hypothetical protein
VFDSLIITNVRDVEVDLAAILLQQSQLGNCRKLGMEWLSNFRERFKPAGIVPAL